MANGLDFGSDATRVARDGLDGAVIEVERPVIYRLTGDEPESTGADGDVALDDVLTVETTAGTYAVGEGAARIAAASDSRVTELFVDGVLVDEPFAEAALETLLDAVLAQGMGNRLCYTTPGTIVDADRPTAHHRDVVDETIASMGFDATPVSTGYAVVADQLRDENVTGLGINVDRDLTSVALVYYGVPVLAFSIAKGKRWIVERSAGATGHAVDQIESRLENFALDPDAPGDDIARAIAAAFDDLTAELVEAIRVEADAEEIERGIAVPVAVAGPWAVEGFEYLLGGRFDAASLPFSIRGIRRADEPAESAVRGALVSAQEGVDAFESVTWSAHTRSEATDASATESDDESTGQLTFEESVGTAETTDAVADGAIEQLFDRLGTRDDELDELDDRVTALADALDELESTAADRSALDALESDLETVSSSVESTAATIDRIEETLTAHESEHDDLGDAIESVESDLFDRLETLSETHESDVDRIEAAVSEQERALEAAVADLEADLDDVESTLASDLGESVDSIREDLARVDIELAALPDDLEERLATLDAAIESEAADRAAAIESIEDSVESIDAELSDDVARVESTVETVESDLGTLEGDVDDLESEVGDVESTLGDIESVVENLESTIEERADDGADEAAVDELESSIDDLRTAVERIESDLEAVDERLSESDRPDEDDVNALRESIAELERVVGPAESSDDESLTESIATLRSSYDDLAAWRSEVIDRLDAVESRQSTLAAEERLTAADVVGDGDEIASTDAVEERVGRVESSLSAELESVSATIEPLESLDRTTAELEDRLESIEGTTAALENGLESLEGELDETVDRAELRETVEAATAADESDLEAIESRVSALESTSGGETDVPPERIADLDQRVHELGRRVDELDSTGAGSADGRGPEAGDRSSLARIGTVGGVASLVAGATVVGGAVLPSIGPAGFGIAVMVVGTVIVAAASVGR
ncbi:hypothetical protein [Halovivax limisalsi]|uniref:hypothetical protein n=1 Tax=Halovivax limisalsi TaxID=1453760 RepID=UPI001FFC9C17|nr:hypothetical protein [Halovivax limisalsi]